MRIGFDISLLSFPNPTGVGQYAAGIIEAATRLYPEDQFDLCAVIPRHSRANLNKYSWLNQPNIKLHILPLPMRIFQQIIPLWQHLPWMKLDTILGISCDIFHHFDWYVYPTSAPMTSTIYDLTPLTEPQWHTHEQVQLFRQWLSLIKVQAKHIFPISESTQCEILHNHINFENNSTVIYPASRFSAPLSSPEQWNAYKTKLNLSGPYFLSVGTIEPRKNYAYILKSFQEFHSQHPEYSLIIVGGPGWDSRALQSVTNIPGVLYCQYLDDEYLPFLYQEATAMIYPSLGEGFGLPVLETLACGGIAVTSNQSSLPEAGGPAAFYCDPYHPETCVETMEHIVSLTPTEHKKQTNQGIAYSHRFSYETSARLMHQAWEKIMKEQE